MNDALKQFEKFANKDTTDCGCSVSSCGNGLSVSDPQDIAPADIKITIDGQTVKATTNDKNIVDAASKAKIGIPAPCYHAKRTKGCCRACVLEIDGEQKFACSTVPKDGMNIVVDKADLKKIRKQRLMEYREGIKSGNHCACSPSGSTGG